MVLRCTRAFVCGQINWAELPAIGSVAPDDFEAAARLHRIAFRARADILSSAADDPRRSDTGEPTTFETLGAELSLATNGRYATPCLSQRSPDGQHGYLYQTSTGCSSCLYCDQPGPRLPI